MRVLYVTSEAYPFCKTGGLADVAGSLPPALARSGVEAAVILPLYDSHQGEGRNGKPITADPVQIPGFFIRDCSFHEFQFTLFAAVLKESPRLTTYGL